MMQQLRKMQQEMARVQEELANTIVDGSAAGGAVVATVNGAFRVTKSRSNPKRSPTTSRRSKILWSR